MAIKQLLFIKNLDLVIGIAFAGLNILWTWHHGRSTTIGVALAFPFVFWFPGYTLIRVLFFRSRLEMVQIIILSIGVSIVIDILGGFVLNMFPWGIRAASWVVFLTILTSVLSLIVVVLQRKQTETPIRDYWSLRIRTELRKHKVRNILVSLGLLVALGMVAYSILFSIDSANRQRRIPFTQLWSTQALQPKNSCSVEIGFNNFEFTRLKYQIIVLGDGALINTWFYTLSPGKFWSTTISLASHKPGDDHIEVLLYRTDKPETVYRNTHLLVHILPAGTHATGNICKT